MGGRRFDVVVAGAGPAGSIAALVLARAGARVALADKARFPRPKACGDLVGPKGLGVLDALGIVRPPGLTVRDMVVIGPTGRRVTLRFVPGIGYPSAALAVSRTVFDQALRDAALEAGAHPFYGRVELCQVEPDKPSVTVRVGEDLLCADVVVGADGATSSVAAAAGLVDRDRVLWGFALRGYDDLVVDVPAIVWWETQCLEAVPGYGWLFPGPEGRANLGFGIGTLADRRRGAQATGMLEPFLVHARRLGLIDGQVSSRLAGRLGGWLKMGMIGTRPSRPGVLLVGDAAGLVNPLQGEGIAQALTSGLVAAQAIVAGPGAAHERYSSELHRMHLPYHQVASALHRGLVSRPRLTALTQRLLSAPGVGRVLGGGWGLFWNELLDGSEPGASRRVAQMALAAGKAATAFSSTRHWFYEVYTSNVFEEAFEPTGSFYES